MAQFPVLGTDSKVPLYDPNRGWRMWNIKEIYLGTIAEKKAIPNLEDLVVDTVNSDLYKVTEINQNTFIPMLVPFQFNLAKTSTENTDLLLGVGPGTQSDTYRIYIDKTVIPHVAVPDQRLFINRVYAKYYKVFVGSVVTGNERAISCNYDQSGRLIDNSIGLDLVSQPNGVNYAVYTPREFYINEDIQDNELLTCVFYTAEGTVISKRQCLAENTAYIRDTDTQTQYISSISLKSPFLSKTRQKTIELKKNVPISGLELMGVVNYSGGKRLEYPVDGTKFSIMGLESFVATIEDQLVPIVLKYQLSPTESVYGASINGDKFITENYSLIVSEPLSVYSTKLYCYPVWVNEVVGYRLEWYMTNLLRDKIYSATHAVKINQNSKPFNPTQYGVSQELSVSVYLDEVSGQLEHYKHVQTVTVVLMDKANTSSTTPWVVGTVPGQSLLYGRNVIAQSTFVNQNLYKLYVGLNCNSVQDWLEMTYKRLFPIYDHDVESGVMEPNFFVVCLNDTEITLPIDQYKNTLTYTTEIKNFSNVYIKFIKRIGDVSKMLGICSMTIKQTN